MPKGELIINSRDAYDEYGISMTQAGLSALMTPAPMKGLIESKSRQTHGKNVVNKNPRFDSRDLTLPIQLTARNRDQFFERYSKFCNEILATGYLEISTKYQPNIVYRCYYTSCTPFSEFITEYASFSLKLTEPDPTNRAKDDAESTP